MSSEVVAFSEQQQAALIGHTFTSASTWDRLVSTGVTPAWFVTNRLADAWQHLGKFRETYGRSPASGKEVREYASNMGLEANYCDSLLTTLKICADAAKKHGADVLDIKIIQWAKARKIAERTKEIEAAFNKGQHDAAGKIIERAVTDIKHIELLGGVCGDDFKTSAERCAEESRSRHEQSTRILSYGNRYLDEALGGIIPTELCLIGASTGAGKTDLVKGIAEHNARSGKKVSMFALEAEEGEIERRIKYSVMAKKFKEDHPGAGKGVINYMDWRMGKNDLLESYENLATAYFEQNLTNLRTYYRIREDFSISTLEKRMLAAADDTDLFILDHLHYVDIENHNENEGMANLTKKIRDLVILMNKPVIAVAHLRKKQEKYLVPGIEEFHGTSNIQKIATTCITLARARAVVATKGLYNPTFFRINKCRLDGDRLYNVAINYYDKDLGGYADRYSLGVLNQNETKWTAILGDGPYWAKGATVLDVTVD